MAEEKIPAVSVIIPMYNAEKYLEECLQSLLNQTLKNIEIILVDDCSTDNSLEIAKNFIPKFEAENKNFVIIKFAQRSGCPGIPRNVALNTAKGKYIFFMDSDDFLSDDALEVFYNAAESFNADVVDAYITFEYKEINGKFQQIFSMKKNSDHIKTPMLETSDIAKRVENIIGIKYFTAVWSKFFRRDFLIKNDIKFPAMTITEDLIFTFQSIVLAKNYVRIPFIGYFYRIYSDSTSKIPRDIKRGSLDFIEGVNCLDQFMQSQKFFIENPKYQYRMLDFFNQWFSDKIFKSVFFDMNLTVEEVYDFYRKEIFSNNLQKNIPLTAYLFVSTNIYKMLVKQQSREIDRLKKLLQDKQ